MKVISAESPANGHAACEDQIGALAASTTQYTKFALVALSAFGLYWLSSFLLVARGWGALQLFGADTDIYSQLAEKNILEAIGSRFWLDRAARFHPFTIVMAAAWMKALSPFTLWITPQQLLKAMFAAVGSA